MIYFIIKGLYMAFTKSIFSVFFLALNITPSLLFAMPRSSSININSSPYSLGTRSERTGMKTGWGMQNIHPSMVDLSEWGGENPSCDVAPECPVCIP